MLQFNEIEQKIFHIINKYAQSRSPPTVARLAGGFVRDRIMGIRSHDIDVVLDNVSGYEFALGLSAGYEDRPATGPADAPAIPSPHKIKANPDKSKHLETATTSILGMSIDFAQLRSEHYAESRIPTIVPGTPVEDAMRRDLTINALFYNLSTDEIEDFTGRGLDDIRNGCISTPLDPVVTLYEDPLRILRILRFRTVFQFAIDDRIYQAMRQPAIFSALEKKVSRERIGIEINKMLECRTGYIGILDIVQHDYVRPIFQPPVAVEVDKKRSMDFYSACKKAIGEFEDKAWATDEEIPAGHIKVGEPSIEPPTKISKAQFIEARIDEGVLWLYIVFHNFSGITLRKKPQGKAEYANALIMSDSLKLFGSRIQRVVRVEASVSYLREKHGDSIAKIVVVCGECLFDALVICFAMTADGYFIDLIDRVLESRLAECYKLSPVVRGEDCMAHGITGAKIKAMLEECFVYQIEHPAAAKEEILGKCKAKGL